MVRRVSPAQLRSQIRQAQQKAQRAVNNYNQSVRKVNQAIDSYNREARAHNARVRANQQRLQREIAKLKSRPTTTRYVTYGSSVQTLQRSFTRVETAVQTGAWRDDRNLLDLAEGETANSVAALNTLLADPAEATEDGLDLQTTAIGSELAEINPDLDARWRGALYALSPKNPDAARHFCTSAREMITTILELEAPDVAVKEAIPDYPKTPNGGVSRRARIQYFVQRRGDEHESLTEFVDEDINSVIALFDEFNRGTHGSAGSFSLGQLGAIKNRVEGAIRFIHRLIR